MPKKPKVFYRNTPTWVDTPWNPIIGCSEVGIGCDRCTAREQSWQNLKMYEAKGLSLYEDYRTVINRQGWTGQIVFIEDRLSEPLRRRKPTIYYLANMSDLFHEQVLDEWFRDILLVIKNSPDHRFITTTKRYDRAIAKLKRAIPPNLWVGFSVHDQESYEIAIAKIIELKKLNKKVTLFLQCEPLLEKIDFWTLEGCDWVVIGGETGLKARFCSAYWIADMIKQCKEAFVPVMVKQLGVNRDLVSYKLGENGNNWTHLPVALRYREYPAIAGI